MTVYKDIEQGTPEWLALRKGKPTASVFSRIVTPAKLELAKGHDSLIDDLIAQTFVPDFDPVPETYWIKRGKEMEPQARLKFQILTGAKLEQVGFCLHPNGILGCSPDSLIASSEGYIEGAEIKCPAPNTHVAWMREGGLPEEHKLQVHGSMIVTGLPRWHFFSFFPGMQPLHVVVHRDQTTAKIETVLMQFCDIYQKAYNETVPKLRLTNNTTTRL